MKEYRETELTPVNGHPITRSVEIHTVTGKVKPGTTCYFVWSANYDGFQDYKTLKDAQRAAREW